MSDNMESKGPESHEGSLDDIEREEYERVLSYPIDGASSEEKEILEKEMVENIKRVEEELKNSRIDPKRKAELLGNIKGNKVLLQKIRGEK